MWPSIIFTIIKHQTKHYVQYGRRERKSAERQRKPTNKPSFQRSHLAQNHIRTPVLMLLRPFATCYTPILSAQRYFYTSVGLYTPDNLYMPTPYSPHWRIWTNISTVPELRSVRRIIKTEHATNHTLYSNYSGPPNVANAVAWTHLLQREISVPSRIAR